MDLLSSAVSDFCRRQGFDHTYLLGYSGGLDSHVLLHLLAALRTVHPLKLRVIHINHQLSPFAQQWALHCERVCLSLQVEFEQHVIQAAAGVNESPEEVARDLRYQVFSKLMSSNDFLLTSHHQDDQAETVLLQMLRGAGPKGLAAMPAIKPFGQGFHARPLLPFTRNELQAYAQKHQLQWIDDESNANTQFTRNFLRHDILPVLKQRWPSVTTVLARVAENCADAAQVLAEVAAQDLQAAAGSLPQTLSVRKLLSFNPVRQRHVLRAWLSLHQFPMPSAVKLQQIQLDMLNAGEDKYPHFVWDGVELRRYRDNLFALRCLPVQDAEQVYAWDLSCPLQLPFGTLTADLTTGAGLRADVGEVTVRFRQGGEMLQLPGRQCRHELKKLMQQWGVPPWERGRVPLIYSGEELVAVVGFAVGAGFEVSGGEAGYWLQVRT